MTDFRLPRQRLPKLESFRPGHVFLMRPGATWLNWDKARPYVLATSCSASQPGVLAYGSTRATELSAGAPCIEVMPTASGVNANRLTAKTFFYPGVLLQTGYEGLPPHLGILGRHLAEFERALTRALGIGTGTCLRTGVPAGSHRGRIVRLDQEIAIELRSIYAVLLTEHLYSREEHYQLLIPILNGNLDPRFEHDLFVDHKDWLQVFTKPVTGAVLPVRLIQSVWHDSDIAAETPYVIDEVSLEQIEAELCTLFELND